MGICVGRTVIITGAASGMGRATAHLFAREGAHVAVTDLDLAACQHVVTEITNGGPFRVQAFALNVSDGTAIPRVVADIAAAFGGIEALPTTFLIDRNGQIRDRKVGAEPTEEYAKKIMALLK